MRDQALNHQFVYAEDGEYNSTGKNDSRASERKTLIMNELK